MPRYFLIIGFVSGLVLSRSPVAIENNSSGLVFTLNSFQIILFLSLIVALLLQFEKIISISFLPKTYG